MAEIIAFEDLKKLAERCEVLTLFEGKPRSEADACDRSLHFPSSRA